MLWFEMLMLLATSQNLRWDLRFRSYSCRRQAQGYGWLLSTFMAPIVVAPPCCWIVLAYSVKLGKASTITVLGLCGPASESSWNAQYQFATLKPKKEFFPSISKGEIFILRVSGAIKVHFFLSGLAVTNECLSPSLKTPTQ